MLKQILHELDNKKLLFEETSELINFTILQFIDLYSDFVNTYVIPLKNIEIIF